MTVANKRVINSVGSGDMRLPLTSQEEEMILANIAQRNAKFYGDKIAVVFGSTRISFREFNSRVNSLVNALSELGVNKGDKLILMTENCHQCLEVAFAGRGCLEIGD